MLGAQAGTRVKAVELCLLYVEVEEDKAEGVVVCLRSDNAIASISDPNVNAERYLTRPGCQTAESCGWLCHSR